MKLKRNWHILLFFFLSLSAFIAWYVLLAQNIWGNQIKVFSPADWFMDYFNTVYYAFGRTPYTWGYLPARNYLPIAYLLLYPMSFLFDYDPDDFYTSYDARFDQTTAIIFTFVLFIWMAFLFYWLYRQSRHSEAGRGMILFTLFCSSITLFNIDRGNEIILTAALCFLFYKEYDAREPWKKHIALISLALAASLKLVPAVLGILLVYKKKFRDILFLGLYTLLFVFLPFLWVEGDIGTNIHAFLENLRLHADAYANGNLGLTQPLVFALPFTIPGFVNYILVALSALSALKLERWQRCMLLMLAMILSTGQQGDYTLILLFLPMVLLFNETASPSHIPWIICFVLLLCPAQYDISVSDAINVNNIRVANTVCSLMYLYLICKGLFLLPRKKA